MYTSFLIDTHLPWPNHPAPASSEPSYKFYPFYLTKKIPTILKKLSIFSYRDLIRFRILAGFTNGLELIYFSEEKKKKKSSRKLKKISATISCLQYISITILVERIRFMFNIQVAMSKLPIPNPKLSKIHNRNGPTCIDTIFFYNRRFIVGIQNLQ